MAKSKDDAIVERLDQILSVLALQVANDKSVTEGVRLLKIAGLDNQTIARVLGTKPAVVRALLSNLRRSNSGNNPRGKT